jgi:hypothetical protein
MNARSYRLTTLSALLLSACAPSAININVKSPPGTNLGRPMYMLVRQVDPKQFANEAYSEVADKVGAPDGTVLQAAVIYPGTLQRFQVKPKEQEGALVVSFLFTAPDGNWQTQLVPEQKSVDFELTVSRILSNSVPATLPTEAPAAPEAPKGAPELPKMPELPKFGSAK